MRPALRGRLAAALLGLAAAGCRGREGAPAPTPSPSPSSRPGNPLNVLLITVDTLRADRMGIYGHRRPTSPRIDALARQGAVFEQAYTYWPKTRASFVMMLTGRRPPQNGYSHQHPMLLDFNPTLAGALQAAGYATAAWVDNANVAAALGYAKGFDAYHEIWERKDLAGEWAGTLAISDGGIGFLRSAPKDRPFFLWLHYVNPHTPYTPPAPFDRAFLDAGAEQGPKLRVMPGFQGGIPRPLYVSGQRRLAYYTAQYDGEIAAVDQEIGRVLDALRASGAWGRTLIVFTSDHGESLGEHDYYFDHGNDLFDPCLRVPLVVVVPGAAPGVRSPALASTLDVLPTVLDIVKLPYPANLAGTSLAGAAAGRAGPAREHLFAQNDHAMSAVFDARYKLVAVFEGVAPRYALYDRGSDPGETRDVAGGQPEPFRRYRQALERFLEAGDREWSLTRRLLGRPAGGSLSPDACERLRALGYVVPPQCGP